MELPSRGKEENLAVPVDLSIKRVPDKLAERLRRRAAKHHRSVQGELMAMLEERVAGEDRLTLSQAYGLARAAGLSTPSKSHAMIRADRDGKGARAGKRAKT